MLSNDDRRRVRTPSILTPRLNRDTLARFLDQQFPAEGRPAFGKLIAVEPGRVRMRLDPRPAMMRPGGIVSGPTLMGMADFSSYAVVLAHIGPIAMAVTNNLNIAFMRACQCDPITVDAVLLKLGRRLATVDARLWQGNEDRLIAQATVQYTLPGG